MKEYDYTLNEKFNTNDDWVETAHGLKELRFVLKKIKDNPTAREWTLTRDDHPRQTLYTNEDGYALIDMLDTVEELGSDALDSDKWNMLTTLTDEDRISMNVNGLDSHFFVHEDERKKPPKDYHECKIVRLGSSDIARLILSAPDAVALLAMGEDGDYHAYLVDRRNPDDKDVVIPKHYTKQFIAEHWLDIYDDEERTCTIHAAGHTINVYRSGLRGILIEIETRTID